jgi:hypothetical protein
MKPLLSVLLLFSSFPAFGQGAWKVEHRKVAMNDDNVLIVSSPVSAGGTHLRCSCTGNGNVYVAFVLPPSAKMKDELTFAMVRLDKKEAEGYMLRLLESTMLVDAVGGSKTGKNYFVVEKGVSKTFGSGEAKLSQEDIRDLIGAMKAAKSLTYQLPMASGGAWSEGRFSLVGFVSAAASIEKKCPGAE